MNKSEARAALRAQGIRNPSPQLVSDWLRMQQAQEWALELPGASAAEAQGQPETPPASAPDAPHPSSESNLEPLLRERGQLERPAGPRKAGRPRVLAPWFSAVANVMSDGTPLREALSICGIHGLTECQIRALYRNRAFQAMYKETRQKWQRELGFRHRRPTVRPQRLSRRGLPRFLAPGLAETMKISTLAES
jgi:hypothetical protein